MTLHCLLRLFTLRRYAMLMLPRADTPLGAMPLYSADFMLPLFSSPRHFPRLPRRCVSRYVSSPLSCRHYLRRCYAARAADAIAIRVLIMLPYAIFAADVSPRALTLRGLMPYAAMLELRWHTDVIT